MDHLIWIKINNTMIRGDIQMGFRLSQAKSLEPHSRKAKIAGWKIDHFDGIYQERWGFSWVMLVSGRVTPINIGDLKMKVATCFRGFSEKSWILLRLEFASSARKKDVPSRKPSHIPPWEISENHRLKNAGISG